MKPKVLVTSFYNRVAVKPALERLSQVADVIVCDEGRTLTRTELMNRLDGIDITIAAEEPYDDVIFERAPQLAMIARDGVGLDSVNVAAATRAGVIVNNAPVVHESVADLAMGLIIAAVRKLRQGDQGMRTGKWTNRDAYLCPDVNGMTLGILGFGRAGQALTRRARGFDMKLLAFDPYINAAAAEALGVEVVDLDGLLRACDILSLHAPLTPETESIINADAIAKMKDGAYLVNTGRGGLVDETALIDAIRSGKLAGAGLDVVCDEPPVADNPLFHLDNVIFTPHVGSDTMGTFAKVYESAVNDILLYLGGKRPAHAVNPAVFLHERCKGLAE